MNDNKPRPNKEYEGKRSSAEAFAGWSMIYGVEGEHRDPYMLRVWFGRLRFHIFYRGDNDPDCHDHPWDFTTFPLTSYVEEVIDPVYTDAMKEENLYEGYWEHGKHSPPDGFNPRRRVVRAFRFHFRKATHAHRVLGRWTGEFIPHPVNPFEYIPAPRYNRRKIVTLVWRSGKKRKWGFLKNRDGRLCWVPWKRYVFEGGKHGPCE